MKVYVLNAIINNQNIKSKVFESREKACRYLSKILDDHNLEVEDIVYRNNKHNQEFICNQYNIISINREIVNF